MCVGSGMPPRPPMARMALGEAAELVVSGSSATIADSQPGSRTFGTMGAIKRAKASGDTSGGRAAEGGFTRRLAARAAPACWAPGGVAALELQIRLTGWRSWRISTRGAS